MKGYEQGEVHIRMLKHHKLQCSHTGKQQVLYQGHARGTGSQEIRLCRGVTLR